MVKHPTNAQAVSDSGATTDYSTRVEKSRTHIPVMHTPAPVHIVEHTPPVVEPMPIRLGD